MLRQPKRTVPVHALNFLRALPMVSSSNTSVA